MPNPQSVYRPEPYWSINSGLNSTRLHKLYSMFFDKQTAFYIGQDVDVMPHNLLKNTYGFKGKKNKQPIFLFKPNGDYRAVYSVDRGSALNTGFVEQELINCLTEIGSFCKKNNESATFVIPFVEMPDRVDKGVQHQVLLTVHYDAVNKKLTSTVHDSIGRDSHLDSLADFLKGRHRSTCNDILSQTLKQTFKTNSGVTVDDVRRIAYNHQNRILEGNCGSYTLRAMKEVISSAAHGTEVKIPGGGYITSDRFLTHKHVRHIEDCIKYRTLSPESVAKSMTQGIQISPQQPDEFISCLEEYCKSRDKIPLEKYMSCFSFFGFTKKTKLAAAVVLINILKNVAADKEISPTQRESLKQHTSCLMNGTLGKLVRHHLKTMGIESLQSLNVKRTHHDGPHY